MRLGVVANEFFDLRLGRLGGFGWAASAVADRFGARPELGVEVVLISPPRVGSEAGDAPVTGHARGHRLLHAPSDRGERRGLLMRERFDLLLTIDWRRQYRRVVRAIPEVPLIVWVRDPRPPATAARIAALRVPGRREPPPGARSADATSLGGFLAASRRSGRPVIFASPAPDMLRPAAAPAYGAEVVELASLPNPIDLPALVPESREPGVVFLGRLDPIKRPWLFVELASRFPSVRFDMLGYRHHEGAGSWEPTALPHNVRLRGHLVGEEKQRALSSAWALVNTSVHEALPVSFLESLAAGTPILSCHDPEGVTSHFGHHVGEATGDGLDSLPRWVEGLRRLLGDSRRRAELGRAGRAWVSEHHTPDLFLERFGELCARAGVARPAGETASAAAAE